jgi:uncharacterized repeat protein (TIGR01451 family)
MARFRATQLVVRVFAWAAAIPFSFMPLHAAATRVLPGHVPSVTSTLVPLGRLDPARRLNLAIGLPLHNREILTNLLADLYDSTSPGFHKFLTPGEFTQLFGPTVEDYAAVTRFAQAHGFTVTQTHGNRVVLDVNASVSDIEQAFGVHLQSYQHPVENRVFFAPDSEPTLSETVPILDISGLDDFSLPRPLVHRVQNTGAQGATPAFGSGPGGTYRGNDFRAAYAPNVTVNGAGQIVGLLEFDGYYASDVTSYESQTGLPNVPLSNVLLDSFNGTPGGANIEVALDIEVAIAMAPGLSQVIVYEAGPSGFPNDILTRMVTDNLAKQLSSSWTWSGGPNGTTDSLFQQMAAQGQSFFQASGDSDAYTSSIPQPSDSPYITVVGGTTLSTSGAGGAWSSETTWNWFNSGSGTNGSSGGISTSYAIPTWQQSVSMAGNQGSTTMRNIPDVALTADNVWVTYNNGSSGAVGGTSCAAPLWAGFAALINQQALGNGKPPMGFLNPALYTIASGSGYSSAFHDITTGNNTNKTSAGKFVAVTGYDLATGLGTPSGSGLINLLAGAPAPQIVSNSLVLAAETCSNNAVDPGETVTLNFGLVNTGSAKTTNLVATLQANGAITSPSAAQTYGVLNAGGAAVMRPFSFTANGSCGGVITATLQLQDGVTSLGSVSFAIRLGAPAIGTTFSQSFDASASPALPANWSTAVSSGIQAKWVTTNGFFDTTPNSAFAPDTGTAAQTELTSPLIPIVSPTAQITFRQNYNLAQRTIAHPPSTTSYDGGVLQISISGGAFTDILAAGGSFVTGGYNVTLATGTANPLSGAQAWGGSSAGWVTTTVTLPAAAAGQSIQLKWALATGVNTFVGTGWFIDSISLQDTVFSCCTPSADVGATQSATPNPASVGLNLVYTLRITNAGPSPASNVAVTDALPSSVTFISASPGCVNLGGSVACTIGTLAAGGASNIIVTVQPTAPATLTNSVTVSTSTTDPNSGNNNATTTVAAYIAPAITSQPTNQTVLAGGNTSFSVSATGSAPLSYQWTRNGNSVSGATSATLGLSNVQPNQGGNYTVIVSNPSGSLTSSVAVLTVLVPPSISNQPTNQTVIAGGSASFQVSASGTSPLNYQWSVNGASLGGATASSLNLASVQTNQSGNYSVVVSNSAGSATSVVAVLTVLVRPTITQQPVSQSAIVGSNIIFQATAAGSTPLTYQWYFNNTGVSGATSSSLTLTNVQPGEGGNYTLAVTNAAGAITSSVAQLTVLIPPSISVQPSNQTAAVSSTVSFVANASGSAPLTYQWWFNTTNAVGTGSNVLTLANVQLNETGTYAMVVSNSAGSITSTVATLTVGTPPSVTQQPSSISVIQDQSASFNLSVGGDSPLTFQWRFNGAPLSGQNSNSITLATVGAANSGAYDAVVANPYGSLTSAVAQLTVLIPPLVTTQPTNQTVIAGNTAIFQAGATGTSPLSFQWWFNGTNTVGSDTNVLVLPNVGTNEAGSYSVLITNVAGSVTSTVAVLNVATPPAIMQQPANQVVIQGQTATFTVGTTGDIPLNYSWLFNGVQVGTSSIYQVLNADSNNGGNYQVIVSNPYGSATSGVATLTVLLPPVFTQQPTNQDVPVGGSASFQVGVSGTAPLAYQWYFDGTNAVGAPTNELTLNAVQSLQAGSYNVVVSNPAGTATSAVATLTVGTPPSITQQPTNVTAVLGQPATFSVGGTGSSPLNYQWQFNGNNLTSGTTSTYNFIAVDTTNAGNYGVIVGNKYGSTTSSVAVLTVLVPPSITGQPTNQMVTMGNSAAFLVTASGTGPINYQWWFNITNAVGADTNALVLNNVQTIQSGAYSVSITNAAGSVTSAIATLTVLVPPSIDSQPTNQTVTAGGNVSFSVAASGSAPLSYQWLLNGTNITGATGASLSISNVQPRQAGTYSVIITNLAGSTNSSGAQLIVVSPPLISMPGATGSAFTVQVSSSSGVDYLLEYKNALQDPTWTPTGAWQPGNGGLLSLQDTNPPTTSRFYRVVGQ